MAWYIIIYIARKKREVAEKPSIFFLSLLFAIYTGEIDCTMLKHLRAKFESVNNHVVEPSEDMVSEYKSRIQDLSTSQQLTQVSCHWYQQGMDEFMESSAGLQDQKFHFISAMHSLYYVKSQAAAVDYLHEKLEEGGLLVIMMQDGE